MQHLKKNITNRLNKLTADRNGQYINGNPTKDQVALRPFRGQNSKLVDSPQNIAPKNLV